jgi:hypothetical protein
MPATSRVLNPVISVQSATSPITLNGFCAMLETAHKSPLDLEGTAIIADAAAAHETSTGQLLWRPPEDLRLEKEWIDSCGWKEGGAPVPRWTAAKNAWTVRNGSVHLPPNSQFWLSGKDLSIENVKFAGVMKLRGSVVTLGSLSVQEDHLHPPLSWLDQHGEQRLVVASLQVMN